jgi:hypothetical protein
MAVAFDMPVSYWLHVAVAGCFWFVLGAVGIAILDYVSALGEPRKAAGRAGFWQSVVIGLTDGRPAVSDLVEIADFAFEGEMTARTR